jgi:tRNA G18 (ribose-2'-O)-methylase SpoU
MRGFNHSGIRRRQIWLHTLNVAHNIFLLNKANSGKISLMMKLNAAQLRAGNLKFKIKNLKLKRNDIYIILDNVLDTYNIGSVFRLADAVAAKKVYLCGETATPPNHRIKKASINTTEVVAWSYKENTVDALQEIKNKNSKVKIIAVEQNSRSKPYDKFDYQMPIALVVGHESDGVSKEVLKMCDAIVELPMYGVNISLNVMVSLGVVLFKVLEKIS